MQYAEYKRHVNNGLFFSFFLNLRLAIKFTVRFAVIGWHFSDNLVAKMGGGVSLLEGHLLENIQYVYYNAEDFITDE